MDDIVSQIKERYEKARAKVDKARKALETARSELSDIEAALRVLSEMTDGNGATQSRGGPSEVVAERQINIIQVLGEGRENAAEPKVLHTRYSAEFDDAVSLDTFRTTIWRMKGRGPFVDDKRRWTVESDGGRYWKEASMQEEFDDILG